MTRTGLVALRLVVGLSAVGWASVTTGEPLTAEQAVQLALQHSTDVINAEAGVLDARSGLYGAYSGVLPQVSASLSRGGSRTDKLSGNQVVAGVITPSAVQDQQGYGTTPLIQGSWSVLNPASIVGLSSARAGLQAALLRRSATRQDVALSTRRQFYEVVKAVRLADVAAGALRLARDNERRVRALFEVGSVSKSDLLRAQVNTSQNQLDSLTARNGVTLQRIALAQLLGIREPELAEVDTVLRAEPRTYEEPSLLAEAAKSRPDLMAAEARLRSAKSASTSARLARLPYVTLSGSVVLSPSSTFRSKQFGTFNVAPPGDPPVYVTDPVSSGENTTDRQMRGEIALNWDLFTGLATDARIAAARAEEMRARDARDLLQRNLASEVHQALIAYNEARESDEVARRTLESATENLKLTQEKYNVGSATVLELIDAQVQLQRAQSDGVSALAAIHVAEAQIDRVRGRAE